MTSSKLYSRLTIETWYPSVHGDDDWARKKESFMKFLRLLGSVTELDMVLNIDFD